jgi:PAS domain S-box-containing protein
MQGLAQTTDLQEFLERIHISVAKVIYAENFFVILYQEDTGLFEEIYFVDQHDPPAPPSKLEMSITSYVFRSGKSILMTQALFDELVEQGEVRLVGTNSESWLGVPLKTPNGIIGVIGVQDYENPDRYSEREKDLLASIGSQVAIAIERKRREETLYDSEKRFRSLFENSPISIWEEDFSSVKNKFEQLKEEGIEDIGAHLKSNPELVVECASLIRILDINNATLKLFEAESKDDLTVPLGKILKPESLEFFTEELVQLAAGETSFYWEGINHTLNGRRIYVNLRLSVLPGYEDTLSRVIVSIFDITERKQAEDQLRKLSRAVEQSASAIVITDRAGSIEYVNPKFIETSGYTTEEAFGQNPRILRSGLIPQQTYEQLWETIVSGKDWNGELLNKKKSGELYWESATISPINNDQGDITHFIAVKEDITERKRAEEEFNRHLMEMEALYENGLAISGMFSLDEIGQQLIETFSNHLFWHHVTIRLVKNKDDLQLIALNKPGLSKEDKSEAERHFNSMVGKVGQGLAGWVVQTGKTLRTGDVHSHPQYIETQAGIQSGLYTPIKIGNEILGVISVESEKADAFLPEDERLLATLANQAAVAFANANLYQAAQQEIAKRRRVENALRTSESHYRELANSITDIMFELDQNLRFTHWNKSSELLTGIPRKKALEKTTREVFGDSRDQMEIDKVFLTVWSTRTPKSVEGILSLNGEEHVYEINVYPSSNGISVIAKDVTERNLSAVIMQKRFELMNFSANSQLEDLMQRMLDEITELIPSQIGFFHFLEEDENTPGKQMWSTQTLQLFNVPDSEGHHQPLDQAGVWADALRQRRPVIQNDYISLSKRKGLPEGHVDINREMVIPIIRNEKLKAVLGIGNKLTNYTQHDLNLAIRFADHAWDIIERKRMELAIANERNRLAKRVEERTADLSHANANLARALRVKDEFLANMSHELRTPLNAILGLSESLAEQTAGPLNEKQSRYINTISESGHHLLSLINDILDLAKIEAGQITLDINKVDVRSISEASLRMVKQLAAKKNQNVELDIDKSIGLIWADGRRLKQMLVNLLSNAVKFTPDDGRLGLEVRGDQSENQVAFAVWDNGVGIKDHDLSRLFQPFIQLDGGLARENTGTGLGLALVAQMARLHGGSVTVESQSEQGSRFTITLPWEPALSPITTERLRNTGRLAPAKSDKKDRTLLLIEDTPEVTMMLQDYLENAGYKVITAQDGLEGIDKAKLTHPDLILMDIQMPRIDGFEATQRLRNDPEFEYTPIIALTALAMPNDRERCLAAGMDEYISKPVNLRMLLKIIQGFLPSAEQSAKPQ